MDESVTSEFDDVTAGAVPYRVVPKLLQVIRESREQA